ncbi:MAG: Crp/Fnr family transcriptional regulator [Cyclobacteriaceae bacterium]
MVQKSSNYRDRLNAILLSSQFESQLIDEISTVGRLKKVISGEILISPEIESDEIPLVLEGTLKVSRKDESGSELLLYFLDGGETCAMSITCCIEGKRKPMYVRAEEDSVMWMIPMGLVDAWLVRYQSFRKFVFQSYQVRFDELLGAIDSIAFLKLDERLYKYLLDKKQASGSYEIHKTHEQIATEMNTSRVVVSRLLKKLEREGRIEQYRNRIDVL